MKNTAAELLITLLSSWAVYGACQQDAVVPTFCGIILLVSFFRNHRYENPVVAPTQKRLLWVNLIGLSLFIGWVWRIFLPDSALLAAGTPGALKIIQTGLVILSFLLWFQRGYYLHAYSLRLASWMIVALSTNVKFDTLATILFWLFCGVNVWFVLAKPHPKTMAPARQSRASISGALVTVLSLAVFLALSGAFFGAIVSLVKLGDRTFIRFIQDYMQPYRHPFFSLQPTLNLRGPGYSGYNIHPVFEIDRGDPVASYLSLQVFEHYHDGTWKEAEGTVRRPLLNDLNPAQPGTDVILFDHLQGVIPTPDGVLRVRNQNYTFRQDENHIVYAPELTVLKASFNVGQASSLAAPPSEKRRQELTQLSPALAKNLPPYVDAVIGTEKEPLRICRMLEAHFQQNFEYDLNVWFAANESGLMTMLRERRPAYCSYFATAMALMLRERGIPSRLRVGFLVTEKIDGGKRLLARVRDAHAWVEALLPAGSGYAWARFDPTPAASRSALLNSGRPLNEFADWLYRIQGRIKSEIINMDTTGMVVRLLALGLAVLLLKNYKDLRRGFSAFKYAGRRRALAPGKRRHPAIAFYEAFENLLEKTFTVRRSEAETDEQFLSRLKEAGVVSPATLELCEAFLRQYHAVRFGKEEHRNLREHWEAMAFRIGCAEPRRRCVGKGRIGQKQGTGTPVPCFHPSAKGRKLKAHGKVD
jgi:hypothetical protein